MVQRLLGLSAAPPSDAAGALTYLNPAAEQFFQGGSAALAGRRVAIIPAPPAPMETPTMARNVQSRVVRVTSSSRTAG